MMFRRKIASVVCASLLVLMSISSARAVDVTVRIENFGAPGSLFLTPFWIGLHDGTFDTYDAGAAATGFGGLEELAEDGDTAPLSTRFTSLQGATGGVDATLAGAAVGPPPFDPGETASIVLNVANPSVNRYFSYASMIVPSNDAFVANGNPLAHPIFDAAGNFLGPVTIDIFGRDVNDAGTEVNSEIAVAFLGGPNGQTGPNQGADESGVVVDHVGFNGSIRNPSGTPMNILGGTTASGALIDTTLGDFTRSGGDVLLARITVIPEPSSLALVVFASISLGVMLVCRSSY